MAFQRMLVGDMSKRGLGNRMLRVFRAYERFLRFGIVGLCSLGATTSGYALLSRWLWPTGSRTVEYVLVTVVVSWLNYESNRLFTFQAGPRSVKTMYRFILVMGIAIACNAVLFWIGHEVLGLYDLAVILLNAFVVAVVTYSLHRLFTFHEDPWRFVRHVRIYTSGG